jgi:murein L,D-transpeptidase YafK
MAFFPYVARFVCFGALVISTDGLKGNLLTGSSAVLAESRHVGVARERKDVPPPTGVSVEHADQIVVVKSEHTLTLLSHGKTIRTYKVALGSGGMGPKDHEDDRKTPEGKYVIDRKNSQTLWHLTLHISYPNATDRARAAAEHLPPGGDIMIHGITKQFEYLGTMQANSDWTYGCIALSNPELDEVSRLVPIGTPIEIRH